MFKAILITFVMQVGYEGGGQTDVGDVNVTLFETMAQCEFAEAKLKEVLPFGWGTGKGDDRKLVKVGMSSDCFEIPEEAQSKPFEVKIVQGEPQIVIQSEERTHKRWNE